MAEGTGVGVGIGMLIGGCVGAAAMYVYGAYIANRAIPQIEKVQEGYVNTSKVELFVRDFNCDGSMVPIMRYKGKSFVLKEDAEGRPVPLEYRLQTMGVDERHGDPKKDTITK